MILIVVFIIDILGMSCNNFIKHTSPSEQVQEEPVEQIRLDEIASEIDPILSDSNIFAFEGLMWGTVVEGQQYSIYFKAFTQRVLFSTDYINVEVIEEEKDPIILIRESVDENNKLIGIFYQKRLSKCGLILMGIMPLCF